MGRGLPDPPPEAPPARPAEPYKPIALNGPPAPPVQSCKRTVVTASTILQFAEST